ncbi:NAD(P)H-hydrate epimerase [Puteibacter caeruleilacunae]|nr:NAD(P)H-hydrate epimerase [Puteibacter caeruleilacunae]
MPKKIYTPISLVTKEQMIEIFRLMIEEYHVSLLQMMENAGRSMAYLARKVFLDNDPAGKRILVLAGTGGNGGGVLAAARHLQNKGAIIEVLSTRAIDDYTPASKEQFASLFKSHAKIAIGVPDSVNYEHFDLVLDGIIGYNLVGKPYGYAKAFINIANMLSVPVLSMEIPSGIHPDDGIIDDLYVKANATMSLALPKASFAKEDVRDAIGRLYVADIGVPPLLFEKSFPEFEQNPLFNLADIIEI